MNYNSTYAMAAICGDVSTDPEKQAYGENGEKSLAKFTLSVTIPGYNGAAPTYMPFQIVAFGKTAEMTLTLQRHQRVLVICDLKNRQKEVKNMLFDNLSLAARHILPFPMPQQKQEQQGQQQAQQDAQPQQQAHQPRILQQQGYNPQQDMQNRMQQQQAQQNNADIPW